MQKILLIATVMLIFVAVVTVIYTQSDSFLAHPAAHGERAPASAAVAPSPRAAVAATQPAPFTGSGLGTEANPVVVKLVQEPESLLVQSEREKDRDIQRAISESLKRTASTSLAMSLLVLFLGVVYFVTLIVLYQALENSRRLAQAALKSAEAAQKTAEALMAKVEKRAGHKKMPPHFYRKK